MKSNKKEDMKDFVRVIVMTCTLSFKREIWYN